MKKTSKLHLHVDTMHKISSSKVTFGEMELSFRFSVESVAIYFDMFGKEIRDAKSVRDRLNYLYSAYLSGCVHEKTASELTVEDFYNLLDDYPLQFVKVVDCLIADQQVN